MTTSTHRAIAALTFRDARAMRAYVVPTPIKPILPG
jgi:hypothetical protein